MYVNFQQLRMERSRKKEQRTTSTEHSQSERTHKEPSGKDLVAMATTSSKRQQLERTKKQTQRKKRRVTRGTRVESMSGVGTGAEDSVKVSSRERHFQGNKRGKDTSMATLESAHVKMDSSKKQAVNKHKKGLEKRRVQRENKQEGRLWLRKLEAPSGKKKTDVWHTKPRNLKEENFEHKKKKTFKRYHLWTYL